MIRKEAEKDTEIQDDKKLTKSAEHASKKKQVAWLLGVLLCIVAFEACWLMSVAPLHRLANAPLMTHLPLSSFLETWGAWLPADLHLLKHTTASQVSTNTLEFLLLMAVAFFIYGLFALLLRFQPSGTQNIAVLSLIWIGAIIAGLILVCTPAMLSHDLFIYADYGRIMVVYRSNPYFVTPAAVSHDAITRLDDWRYVTAAYGPLWLYICSFLALVLKANAVRYIFAFRLLGLVSHLLNTLLVVVILHMAGRSPRTQLLGGWLYAYNPLALLESCLGAHNDALMVSFVLLGVCLSLWAERKNFTRLSYLLPALAFTLSALIKFTTLPLLLFFLVLLARKTLFGTSTDSLTSQQVRKSRWRTVLLRVLIASVVCGLTVLTLYLPFWLGHNVVTIVLSFVSPPSANYAENSILRAFSEWIKLHGMPASASWNYLPVYLLSQHTFWSVVNSLVLAASLLIGAICLWRKPVTSTLTLAALATLGALLIVTPWFYSWYVLWLLGLAVVSLSPSGKAIGQALIAFALTFSVTALCIYLYNGDIPLGDWAVMQCLRILGVPLLVFLIVLVLRWRWLRRFSIQAGL